VSAKKTRRKKGCKDSIVHTQGGRQGETDPRKKKFNYSDRKIRGEGKVGWVSRAPVHVIRGHKELAEESPTSLETKREGTNERTCV